jgi:hypothetical protein
VLFVTGFGADVFVIVFLPESLDATGGIDQFLLAGKEGVAIGTDFNLDVFDRGTGFDNVAAVARDFGSFVIRMQAFLHFFSPVKRSLIVALRSSMPSMQCHLCMMKNKYNNQSKLTQ